MEKRIDDNKYAKVVDFYIKQKYLLFVKLLRLHRKI